MARRSCGGASCTMSLYVSQAVLMFAQRLSSVPAGLILIMPGSMVRTAPTMEMIFSSACVSLITKCWPTMSCQ